MRTFWSIIAGISFILFLNIPPLFDWDEVNFAEIAREMLITKNFLQPQVNFQPFYEKPPLFFWLQALSMALFGVNAFAARLPNALIGFLTLLAIYKTIKNLTYNHRLAWIAMMLYGTTLLPHAYFKSGIIDPTYNFFTFLGVMALLSYEYECFKQAPDYRKLRWLPWIVGFLLGLSTLTKGPVNTALVFITYLLFWLLRPWMQFSTRISFPWEALINAAIAWFITVGLWFVPLTFHYGKAFMLHFIKYQWELYTQPVATHGQPFYYHFIVLLLGCVPAVAFFIPALAARYTQTAYKLLHNFMFLWFWVILLVFSFAKTKIIHYSSLTYFPMVIVAALAIEHWIERRSKIPTITYVIILIDFLLFGIAFLFIPVIVNNVETIAKHWIKDPLTKAALTVPVKWSGYEFLIGIFTFIALIALLECLRRRLLKQFLICSLLFMAIWVNIIYFFIVPKVAQYSQGPAIAFFQSLKGKDVYVIPYGYKTYAIYFYTDRQPWQVPPTKDPAQLLRYGKPVYCIMKIHSKRDFEKHYPMYRFLWQKGYFCVFFADKTSSS